LLTRGNGFAIFAGTAVLGSEFGGGVNGTGVAFGQTTNAAALHPPPVA